MVLFRHVADRSRTLFTIAGVILVVILAVIDDVTGHEFHLSFVYILPIILVSFFLSQRVGILMSILSAVVWFVVDLRSEFSYSVGAHVWNAVVRLTFFILVTHGIYLLVKARRRDEELTSFIIHDLKTPLANMVAGFHCIREQNPGDARIEEFAGMGLSSGKRMEMMIHSLIDLGKMEGGEKIAMLGPMDVEEVAHEAMKLISLWADKSNVRLRLMNEVGHQRAKADKEIVVRVLSNLLGNAIKVSPKDGTVTIRIWNRMPHEITYSIQDQGPGIPIQWRERIFHPAHIAETKQDGIYRGSGLGLTFCRMAVHDMGGDIWVDSHEGKGTTVTFTLSVSK